MSDPLREALHEIAEHPLSEVNPDGDEQAGWTMRLIAREALAVEPAYEYRAVVAKMRPERSCWYGGQHGESTASGILADQLGSAGLLTGWVERRVVGPPELVS